MLASSLCCWLGSGGMVFLPRCGSLLCLTGDVYGIGALQRLTLFWQEFLCYARTLGMTSLPSLVFGFIFDSPIIPYFDLFTFIDKHCQHLYVCLSPFHILDGAFGAREEWKGGGTNEYLTNPQLACLRMACLQDWMNGWLAGLGGSTGVHGRGGTLLWCFCV